MARAARQGRGRHERTDARHACQAVGLPVIGLSGLVDLGHGGLRDFAESDIETVEVRRHDQLERYLGEGDLHVGDRLFSSYEVVARDK